ncbi:MAG TPA: vitamin K epoxide reductase family protein, partial [Candidatus Bathyarchaeia archaeon]|nr:vitamin K epoxide reductase family protein [Candidatus Bathyarchaeia archaeon]
MARRNRGPLDPVWYCVTAMAAPRHDRAPSGPARPDRLVAGLAAAGLAIAVYLTWLKWTGATAAFCLSGGGCDVVQSSRYATLLGAPVALWGALLYLGIGILAVIGPTSARWSLAVYLAAAGAGVSVYLTALSFVVIHATCAYCLASTAIMLVILLALWPRRATLPGQRPRVRSVLTGAVAAAVLVPLGAAFIYAMPSGMGAGDEEAL